MKSYFELETFDDVDSLELGVCIELSCSCFCATSLFTNRWYYKKPSKGTSIYIDKGKDTIELAPTWKENRVGYRRIYR